MIANQLGKLAASTHPGTTCTMMYEKDSAIIAIAESYFVVCAEFPAGPAPEHHQIMLF